MKKAKLTGEFIRRKSNPSFLFLRITASLSDYTSKKNGVCGDEDYRSLKQLIAVERYCAGQQFGISFCF